MEMKGRFAHLKIQCNYQMSKFCREIVLHEVGGCV